MDLGQNELGLTYCTLESHSFGTRRLNRVGADQNKYLQYLIIEIVLLMNKFHFTRDTVERYSIF